MAARRVVRTPALIVGGGPVGLYSSALLSAYGVPSVLAERSRAGPSSHPRAHLINTRSMEILRELGVDERIREQIAGQRNLLGSRGFHGLAPNLDFFYQNH